MKSTSSESAVRETRELLDEVRQTADEALQGELNLSVTVLLQLLDVWESWQHADSSSPDEAVALAEFIAGATTVLQSSSSGDSASRERVEQLSREAVDRWGDYLSLGDDAGFELTENDAWGAFSSAETDDPAETDETDETDAGSADIDSPSEQDISDLLAQLANSCATDAPSSAEPRHAAPSTAASGSGPTGAGDTVEIDDEIREAFLDDAGRCLRSMEDALLAYETDPESRAPLQQICRELHTLKGAAGSVGLVDLADDLHGFEDSLRDGAVADSALPNAETLLARLDGIRKQVEQVAAVGERGAPTALHLDRSEAPFAETGGDDESVRVKTSQLNRLMDMLAELIMLRNRRDGELNELKGIHSELIHSVSRLRSIGEGGGTEVASDILESAQRLRACYQPVAEGNLAVSQFIRQFRQELVKLRRMPVSGLFRRLQRVASDAARAERKQVRLQLVGEDAGIERSLQERLYEPLLHIIRNAVSHGIEEPEERSRLGKEPAGTVTLEAQTSSDLLVLEIRDNGRGLNYDALRRRGIEQGLLKPDMAATREELALLIFHPGFSTQQTTSQISGRGVGMDVVASAIARMRGWVEVDSSPGQGTTVRLTFPLPSVIQHTMVFRSAGQIFALPMQFVQAAGSSAEEVRAVPFSKLFGSAEAADDRDDPQQMLVLASQTPQGSSSNQPNQATAANATLPAEASPLALLVDEIVGPEEVVVRPLPSLLKHHPLCSGATLSGMGEVVLVLDTSRLMDLVLRHAKQPATARTPAIAAKIPSGFKTPPQAETSPDGERPRVLVVDDSLSARKRLVRSLDRYQLEIIEASDGLEAVERLETQAFAAVFSDLEMPRQNGLELLAEIRTRATAEHLPVVIVSSRGEDTWRNRATELGVNAYLTKPLADSALDEAVASLPTPFRRTRFDYEKPPQTNGETV